MKYLDLRGLKCPLPVLRTRKALAGMAPGECVEVACTDPMSAIDLPHMLRDTGDLLESQNRMEGDRMAGVTIFVIRKQGPKDNQ